jgi:hypothetical protein
MAAQLIKKFPACYGNWRFITVFNNSPSLDPVPSVLNPISLRSSLILSSHLCIHFPSGFFRLDFPTNILYAIFISPVHGTYPHHLILFYSIILITGRWLSSGTWHHILWQMLTSTRLHGVNILEDSEWPS